MSITPSLLCPIDFSPSSVGALHYALAIARRFHVRLTVMTVDEPLLAEISNTRMGEGWSVLNSECELRSFVANAEGDGAPVDVTYEVRIGKAAPEILDLSRSIATQLIVMSTHGRSGVRRLLFGATAERILSETTVPVLLVPSDPGPLSFDALAIKASPMLVSVDFSSASAHQVRVAGLLAKELHLRVLVGHVTEPVDVPVPEQIDTAKILYERQRRAGQGLQLIAVGGSMPVVPEVLIASGQPAEQIARWIAAHDVGLLVMALHSSADGGPRTGIGDLPHNRHEPGSHARPSAGAVERGPAANGENCRCVRNSPHCTTCTAGKPKQIVRTA